MKKIFYALALALFACAVQNAGFAAEGGVKWRSPDHKYWDYIEQRQEFDEAAWKSLPPQEQKTMLEEAGRACSAAGNSVKLLSGNPLDGDRLAAISDETGADALACFKQEGRALAEKVTILRGIKSRAEQGKLAESDLRWLEENNVSWADKYKETFKFQALKPKFAEQTARQQHNSDRFAAGPGGKLAGVGAEAREGKSGTLDKFFDGGGANGQETALAAGAGSGKLGGRMGAAGKSPEEQKLELMQRGAAPPSLAGAPTNPEIKKEGITYKKIEGSLYSSNKGGDIYTMAINQGETGDCYFLSSAAAIAKKDPQYIKNSIRENKDGTYSVDFYREKPWWKFWGPDYTKETVTVDNQFPTKNGNPAFNHSKGNGSDGKPENMWGMVYEKAYAKFQGSYEDIGNGGWPSVAMAQITGKGSTTQSTGSTTLANIEEWEKKGYAVTAATKTKPPNTGVVGGHAYYVLSVDKANGTVTLGNPWGFKNVTLTEAEFKANYDEVYYNTIR